MLIGLFIGIAGAVSLAMIYYYFLGAVGMLLGFLFGMAYVLLGLFGLINPVMFVPAAVI